jgi:membrane-associated phospholipid phosphatase
MTLSWGKLVIGCFLIFASGSTGTRCFAAPQQQPADARSRSALSDATTTSDAATNKLPVARSEDSQDFDTSLGPHLMKRLASDQEQIWTFPGRIRMADADWVLPFAVATAGLFATDTEFTKHLSNSPSRLKKSTDFSNYGLGAMGGLAGGLYLWGKITRDDHKRETGFLAAEAALNSLGTVYVLKYSLRRERPLQDSYRGKFWSGGDSFPSEHAAGAWSIASVVAHEYPGTLTQILAYGMASAVSISRVAAKQHFPSDVLIGSAIGWLSGEVVYRAHHDPELGGSSWQTLSEARAYFERERPRQNMGTTFVELDSWVYPAFDRLAGLGYIHTSLGGLRPWTRMQCARLVAEASETLLDREFVGDGAGALVLRLRHEFSYEMERLDGGSNRTATLESIYTRAVSINGPALTDGFHFGQTVSYDFGRPFERGTNLQEGGAFRATAGPIAVYVRAEYQHAPGAPAPSDAVRNIIALRDLVPEPAAIPVSPINRPRLLDAYVGVNLGNWQILVGRQSLSWGPGPGGSLLWSDNSEPVDMVHIVNSEPSRLPGFLGYLGPLSVDDFIGRLEDNRFIQHPLIYGNKISLKPFPNFEFGFGRTVTIGGKGGDPLTPGNFLDSFFGRLGSNTAGHSVPGDNHVQVDWTFKVPKVGDYLVFYGDWYADDDPIPLQAPRRSAYRPGLYIPHFPHLPKLDFHFEAANTDSAVIGPKTPNTGDLDYWNFTYRDGYTNNGFLIGNVVGRLGQTYEGWLTYWASSRDTVQLTYKNSSVDSAFIPGGGAWQDYGLKNEMYLKSGIYIKSQIQYERISHFPILFKGPQSSVTGILEIGFSHDAKQKSN